MMCSAHLAAKSVNCDCQLLSKESSLQLSFHCTPREFLDASGRVDSPRFNHVLSLRLSGTWRWWEFKSIAEWSYVCDSVRKKGAAFLLFVVWDNQWPGALSVSFFSCFLFQVSLHCFQWKMDSWMMAVGSNLYTAAWARLTASLTRMEKEWNAILARCSWAGCLPTSTKVHWERSVSSTIPRCGTR